MVDLSDHLLKLIEGQAELRTIVEDVRHDLKNYKGALDAYVPAKEIKLMAEASNRRHEQNEARLDRLEGAKAKWFGPVLSAALSTGSVILIGLSVFVLRKLGVS